MNQAEPRATGVVSTLLPWIVAFNVGILGLQLGHASEAVMTATTLVGPAALCVAAGYLTRVRGGPERQATSTAWRVLLLSTALGLATTPILLVYRPDLFANQLNRAPGGGAVPPLGVVLILLVVFVVIGALALGFLWVEAWLMARFGYWVAD